MQGSRFFGSDEWFTALRKQIFDDMENKCFWEKALNKDDLNESRRSHIDRHIGKTASDLIQRGFAEISLKNNAPDTFLSSTFTDAATLEARLEDCLTTMLLFSPDEFCALAEATPDTRISLLAAVDPISWTATSSGTAAGSSRSR